MVTAVRRSPGGLSAIQELSASTFSLGEKSPSRDLNACPGTHRIASVLFCRQDAKLLRSQGMTITQDGDSEGIATFDPACREQPLALERFDDFRRAILAASHAAVRMVV